jgi:putative transposase
VKNTTPPKSRRSVRLKGHDYRGPSIYFITICAHAERPLFGVLRKAAVQLSEAGAIVQSEWLRLASSKALVALDLFVIMPDHFHGIIELKPGNEYTLGEVLRGFKARVTRGVHALDARSPGGLWQRNYYERIIRDQNDLDRIRAYIRNKPKGAK